MNINIARKIQKSLFTKSFANPHIGTAFHHITGKLCYYVSHKMSDNEYFTELPDEWIKAINERKTLGIEIAIKVHSPQFSMPYPDCKRYGIFLLEIINVD